MFYARLAGSLLLFGFAAFWIGGRRATFSLGGDPDSTWEHTGVVHVDAEGYDAVAIGIVPLGLGLVNLALGIRGRSRLVVFWWGAGLLAMALIYGIGALAQDAWTTFLSRTTP